MVSAIVEGKGGKCLRDRRLLQVEMDSTIFDALGLSKEATENCAVLYFLMKKGRSGVRRTKGWAAGVYKSSAPYRLQSSSQSRVFLLQSWFSLYTEKIPSSKISFLAHARTTLDNKRGKKFSSLISASRNLSRYSVQYCFVLIAHNNISGLSILYFVPLLLLPAVP